MLYSTWYWYGLRLWATVHHSALKYTSQNLHFTNSTLNYTTLHYTALKCTALYLIFEPCIHSYSVNTDLNCHILFVLYFSVHLCFIFPWECKVEDARCTYKCKYTVSYFIIVNKKWWHITVQIKRLLIFVYFSKVDTDWTNRKVILLAQ